MKNKNFLQQARLIVLLSLLLFTFQGVLGQTQSIIAVSSLTPAQLNAGQAAKYNKLTASSLHDNFQIVQVQNLATSQVNSKVKLALPYLPCNDLIFTATRVDYVSENDYYWYGIIDSEDEDHACKGGFITLMSKGGEKFGTVTFDDYSYEFQDLGDGVQTLARFKLEAVNENECGVNAGTPNYRPAPPGVSPSSSEQETVSGRIIPCTPQVNDEVRVLVLWTPAAAAIEANINNRIALAIAQTNQAYLNSQVGGTLNLVLAGSQQIAFNETNITPDVNTLGARADVQALRTALQADLVILLTNGNYGGTFGIVRAIGPDFANAYSVVQTNAATGGRFTFAHEVGHLFGARHDTDPNGTIQHGYTFRTGGFLGLFSKKRYTLLATMEAGKTREQHYSNPEVRIKNKPTGTVANNNNAQQHRNTAAIVANFFVNPPFNGPMSINILQDNPNVCCTFVTAEAEVVCGTAPFYFNWLISYDGINWQLLPNSEIVSFATACDQSTLIIELAVTDANGQFRTVRQYYNADCGQTVRMVSNDAPRKQDIPETHHRIIESVYPNPAKSSVLVSVNLPSSGSLKLEIVDELGNVRKQLMTGVQSKGKNLIPVNTSGLLPGVYRIRIYAGSISESQQLLIVK